MNNVFKRIIIIFLAILLLACGKPKENKTDQQTIYVVKSESFHKSLYFSGTIQPLKENSITSPLDAVVETINFHYGHTVKNNDVIMTLNSNELQKLFNDTLTDYLKAKDSYSIAKAKFTGTQELWDAGLLSKNNYLSEKSSVNTSRISLMQASRKLSDILEKMDIKNMSNLSSLNIAEFEKVKTALTTRHNLIQLKAPAAGVLLYPPKSSEDKSIRLSVGSAVKAGQVLALVGDLTGIRVEIDVPEIDIDKIHTGMDASITGVALGKQVLHGKLIAVNAQASTSNGGNLPSFSATVEVNNLSTTQQQWIKVGMSANIELSADSDKQLLVPIAAIKQENGTTVVTIKTKQGKLEKKVVLTGAAQADRVIIEQGLQPGDQVVYG